jgi:cytochrome P450
MRTISWLLGIPEEDQEAIRAQTDDNLRTEEGKPMDGTGDLSGRLFTEYIDWREQNPSDDIMTQLLQAEFEDESGRRRRLTRDELGIYCQVIAGAGNETTNRLIGWTVKTLAEHPDQRKELVQNPGLIPNAIEEVLRYEPPAHFNSRYVAKDAEIQGQTVPAGSVITFLNGSANRDEEQFADGDSFDIHRKIPQTLTFGRGPHFCLGAALARLEGQIVLEEMLKRFPEWEVDTANGKLSSTSTVRGWESLPIVTG